jgi:hypothetical protein
LFCFSASTCRFFGSLPTRICLTECCFSRAIIYGTLYLLFAAFPIVYQQKRGWSPGIGGLAFLGVAVGMLFAIAYCLWDNKRYKRVATSSGGFAPPEARLPMSMVGACALPIGLFWFAWTNSPSIHWIVSIAAGAPFGFGMILVFLGVMNYLIDAYTIYAASALAANSVLRSLFGMAFPLFTSCTYARVHIPQAKLHQILFQPLGPSLTTCRTTKWYHQ